MTPAWRVGRHQPINVYRDDEYVAVVFSSPELAARVVAAMNLAETLTDTNAKGQLAADAVTYAETKVDETGEPWTAELAFAARTAAWEALRVLTARPQP